VQHTVMRVIRVERKQKVSGHRWE